MPILPQNDLNDPNDGDWTTRLPTVACIRGVWLLGRQRVAHKILDSKKQVAIARFYIVMSLTYILKL